MSTPGTDWRATMAPDEVAWCDEQISLVLAAGGDEYDCVDNWRAARAWKSSQVRRFRRDARSGCCGSLEWIALRWSWRKLRWDRYLLGFNYGH